MFKSVIPVEFRPKTFKQGHIGNNSTKADKLFSEKLLLER